MVAYSQEICDKICNLLSEGISLTSICKQEGMPSITAVMNWLADERYTEFLAQYARARDSMADAIAEEIIDIADNEMLPADSRRIRVDVRKWYAGKVRPKKYGDKQIIGGDPDNPVALQVITGVPRSPTE